MKKTTKLGVMALAGIASASLLSACVGEYHYTLPTVSITSDMLTELESRTDNPVEINFWHGFGSGPTGALDPLIEKFNTDYPYIKVIAETKSGYDNLKEAISLSLATNTAPDVALGYPDHFAEYITSGIQVPLEDYINFNDPANTDATAKIGVANPDDFYDNYMRENEEIVPGHIMGLPFNKSTEVMIYNRDIFAICGITSAPNTWEEVYTTAKTIYNAMTPHFGTQVTYELDGVDKTLDFTGVTADNFYPMSYDSQANFFITICRQWGGVYTEADNLMDGKIRFDNPQTREALAFVKQMHDEHLLGIPASWEETSYCSKPFKAYKTAMGISSSAGVYNNISAGGEYELGIKAVPYHEGGVKAVIQQGTNIAILSNAVDENNPTAVRNRDIRRLASWIFIKYLTGEANVPFAIGASYLPVRASGTDSSMYQTFLNTASPSQRDQSIQNSARISTAYNGEGWLMFTDPAFIGSSFVRGKVELIIPAILASGQSIDRALKDAYDSLSQYR